MSLLIEIINKSPHPLPAYASTGSAGLDIKAWLTDAVEIKPMERLLISTGLYLALPQGYEAQIRPRSGMAIKKGITMVNAPGTIDSDYRGELKIAIINLSTETQTIEDGDRIAQMIIARHEQVEWRQVSELAITERGQGGFGSSGKN